MKKIKSGIAAIVAVLLLILNSTVFAGAESVDYQEMLNLTLEAKAEEYGGDTLSPNSDWFNIAKARLGKGDSSYLARLEESVRSRSAEDFRLATEWHRTALTVNALGGDARNFGGYDLIAEGIFNNEDLGKQGVNGYIWALIVLDSKDYEIPVDSAVSRKGLIKSILENMQEAGSFTLNGRNADTDVTAMALTALSVYKDDKDIFKFTNADGAEKEMTVGEVIEISLNWLSETQKENGGFAEWGTENAESTAQVIIALYSLGIDIEADRRFIKSGNTLPDGLAEYYIEGGGFAHIINEDGEKNENAFATVQGLMALTAYVLFENGGESYYDLNTVKEEYSAPETLSQAGNGDGNSGKAPVWKYLLIGFGVLALLTILIFAATKIRSIRDLLIFAAIAAVIAILLVNTEFQSVDEYYQEHLEDIQSNSRVVTLSINCRSALESGKLDETLIKEGYIPEDGWIIAETKYVLREGDTAFDILQRAVKDRRIQLEFQGGGDNTYGTVYIQGISYLYEFDCGSSSGWMYSVNGENPNNGISKYYPNDGDKIEIYYVTDYTE